MHAVIGPVVVVVVSIVAPPETTELSQIKSLQKYEPLCYVILFNAHIHTQLLTIISIADEIYLGSALKSVAKKVFSGVLGGIKVCELVQIRNGRLNWANFG